MEGVTKKKEPEKSESEAEIVPTEGETRSDEMVGSPNQSNNKPRIKKLVDLSKPKARIHMLNMSKIMEESNEN